MKVRILIKFDDNSTREYEMPYVLDKPWGREFVEKCKVALIDRMNRFGRDAGTPGEDLRHYNGNHATGRGRHPGPKPVEIVKEWVA